MSTAGIQLDDVRPGVVLVHENVLAFRRRGPVWIVIGVKRDEILHLSRITLRGVLKPDKRMEINFGPFARCAVIVREAGFLGRTMDRVLALDNGRNLPEHVTSLHALRLQLPSHASERLAAQERIAAKRQRRRDADDFWQGSDKRPKRQ